MWSCGENNNGQLGLGDNSQDNNRKPTKIKFFEEHGIRIVLTESGFYNSLAVDENGKIYAWGQNDYGQCGDGTTEHRHTPQLIKKLEDKIVVDVRCGTYHCAAMTDEGEVYVWGKNDKYH